MKQFFKIVLAVIVAQILITILGFFLLFGMIASIGSSEPTIVNDNSILRIDLSQAMPDRASKDFTNDLASFTSATKPIGLQNVIQAIDAAKDDERIKGIYLESGLSPLGFAAAQELRNALADFKESGKFIYAYGEMYSHASYFVASVADKVCMHQEGGIELVGLSSQVIFFKGLMEKIGVEMQVLRHGKFKSAVEPFLYDKMSPENREQYTKLLNSVWESIVAQIGASRDLSPERIQTIADQYLANDPNQTVKLGLIDHLYTRDEMTELFKSTLKVDDEDKLSFLPIDKYISSNPVKVESTRDKIAVIYAEGEIDMGKGSDTKIGSENISKAIRKAAKDKHVKAIVLRVNSPGGSSLASEIILNEVSLAKKTKPFIVSFGNVAASGGYYIACLADHIFAQSQTLTGSIGVFGTVPNVKKLLNSKLGVTVDQVGTNANSNFSMAEPMSDFQRQNIQAQIVRIYNTFISHVADGRNLRKTYVDSIGQGRVWTGADALELGLVDEIGGLGDAIAYAALEAKVDLYRIQELPVQKTTYEAVLESMNTIRSQILRNELGSLYPFYEQIKDLSLETQIHARLPYQITIK